MKGRIIIKPIIGFKNIRMVGISLADHKITKKTARFIPSRYPSNGRNNCENTFNHIIPIFRGLGDYKGNFFDNIQNRYIISNYWFENNIINPLFVF